NVLGDIIKSNAIKTIKLDKIFRQSMNSMIVQNAHLINKGYLPVYNKKDTDFFYISGKNNLEILDIIEDLYINRLPAKYVYDPIKDIQILAPMKKGESGVVKLNKRIQQSINPSAKIKKEKNYGKYTFRVGDKVMQIKNNYQAEWTITNEDQVVTGEGI